MAFTGRVTEQSIHNRVLANLQRNIAKSEKIQEQLASGKQLNRPSDSPTGTVSALQLRTETRANSQYIRNADDGLGWLSTVESVLGSASTMVSRVRDLTVQGLNAPNTNSQAREALATEVDQIFKSLVAQANTRFLDRPVLGGTTAGMDAYDQDGSYLGDTGQTTRTVASGTKVRVDLNGTEAFGAGPNGLFAVLTDISAALRSGDTTALGENLGRLDASTNVLRTAVSDVGARYNRVAQAKESAQDRLLSVAEQLSDIEDIDLPKTIMEMHLQQTSYQAALAASAKVIQPSLIDFLR